MCVPVNLPAGLRSVAAFGGLSKFEQFKELKAGEMREGRLAGPIVAPVQGAWESAVRQPTHQAHKACSVGTTASVYLHVKKTFCAGRRFSGACWW